MFCIVKGEPPYTDCAPFGQELGHLFSTWFEAQDYALDNYGEYYREQGLRVVTLEHYAANVERPGHRQGTLQPTLERLTPPGASRGEWDESDQLIHWGLPDLVAGIVMLIIAICAALAAIYGEFP